MSSEGKMKDNIRKYIAREHSKGYAFEDIAKQLIKVGYPHDMVSKITDEIKSKHEKFGFKISGHYAMLYALALVGVVAFIFYIASLSSSSCDTKECFIENANLCKESEFTLNKNNTIYKLVSNDKCEVTKEATKISPDEPSVIKELLEGNSMTCKYEKGNFNPDIVDKLVTGTENCSGELKDGLNQIIVATYEVQAGE